MERVLEYNLRMNRTEAIEKLRMYADAVRGMGATSLYLFGSTARADARIDSDIDLFLEYDPAGHFSALDLVGIKLFLEEELGAEVDLTTRNSLHPLLRADIEQSAVRVF
jgi:predicted nucleotidyltransferase